MKAKEQAKVFHTLGRAELVKKIAEMEEELMKLRFKHSSGQLTQTAQLGQVRRRIAQAKTILNQTTGA